MTNDILLHRPSLPRLAPLDELQPLTATAPAEIETLSPSTGRNRLESTTSSRFFPGGWFSGPSKTPEERTSLDHASGEFSKTSVEIPKIPGSLDVPDTDAPANTPIDGPTDEHKKKDKWCVIM